MRKKVLYLGNFSFPLGNAAGKRVYANGKILKEMGYEVFYIGMDKDLNKGQTLIETKRTFDSFTYYNFSYPKNSLEWINYKKTFENLIKLLREEKKLYKLDMIIYYGNPRLSIFNALLINYCKKNNIKIVADCVDWLTIKTNNPFFNIIKNLDNKYQKSYLNKKTDGIIVISDYLSNYYKKYECDTVVIPPLSPFKAEIQPSIVSDNRTVVISYAGIPFRKGVPVKDQNKLKDRIDQTIILLSKSKSAGRKFLFNIYGFTKSELLEVMPSLEEYIDQLGSSIQFHGFQKNEDVTREIRKSDFTILLRDVNRGTSAGFPTKVSESLSNGTPVITTRTSDLENYITEGKNGYFINTKNEKELMDKFNNILSLSESKRNEMKKYCQIEDLFYYKKFEDDLADFLNVINL